MVTKKELHEAFAGQAETLKKQLDDSISAIRLEIMKTINEENKGWMQLLKLLNTR